MANENDVVGKVEYTGGEKSSGEIEKVSKALDKNAQAAAKDTTALKENEKAVKGAGTAAASSTPNIGQFGSAIGLAGQAVAKLNPSLGQLTTMAGSATGAMQALSTAGLGPVGIALTVVSLAVTAGSALYAQYVNDEKAASDAANVLAESLNSTANSFDNVAAARARDRVAEERTVAMRRGTATAETYATRQQGLEQEISRLRNRTAEEETAFAALSDSQQVIEDRRRQHRIAEANRELDTIFEQGQIADQREQALAASAAAKAELEAAARAELIKNPPRTRHAAHAPDTSYEDKLFEDQQRRLEEENRLLDEADALQLEKDAAAKQLMIQQEQDYQEELLRLQQKAIDYQAASELRATQERSDAIDEENASNLTKVLNAKRREQQAHEKFQSTMADINTGVGEGFSVLSDVVQAAAGSSKASQESMLKTMAAVSMTESIIKAAIETAESISSFATYNYPAGVGHAMAAAAFGVAATKAGIVAGGGGGAVGSGVPSAHAQAYGNPSTSTVGGGPSSGGSSSGGPTNITINWGSAGLVYAADRVALGRTIEDMIAEANARTRRTRTG